MEVVSETETAKKLLLPKNHKAKILTWTDLTVNDADIISELNDPLEIKQFLLEKFGLNQTFTESRALVLLDLCFYTVQFAKERAYSKEQLSTLFSIIKKMHEVTIETPFDNFDQVYLLFQDLLLCHSVRRPPMSIDVFSPEQSKEISNYVINSYFKHFKLYKYVFTPLVRMDLCFSYEGVPESPSPSIHDEEEDAEKVESEAGRKSEEPEIEERQEEETEESAAMKELRTLIDTHLSSQLAKLQNNLETQLQQSEELLNDKLRDVEGQRSPRRSRGKKK